MTDALRAALAAWAVAHTAFEACRSTGPLLVRMDAKIRAEEALLEAWHAEPTNETDDQGPLCQECGRGT